MAEAIVALVSAFAWPIAILMCVWIIKRESGRQARARETYIPTPVEALLIADQLRQQGRIADLHNFTTAVNAAWSVQRWNRGWGESDGK